MQYLVTGAAGFIGSQVAEALLLHGNSVIGVDAFTRYYARSVKQQNLSRLRTFEDFRFVEADLRTADLLALLDGSSVVVHQAGQPGVRPSWGDQFVDYVGHNIVATQRLLEAARRTDVQRFVYASSSSIYGNAASFPTTETTLPHPFSPYGMTKLAGEHLCTLYAENWGLSTVALRYFTVYGPRQRPDMAINRFITAALEGREIEVYGDGEQRRDFTYVGDVVRANLLAAQRPLPSGCVINIAGGSYATVNMVLEHIAELVGEEVRVRHVETQAGDVEETGADCRLARLLLGWDPTVQLSEGLARQVRWHSAGRLSLVVSDAARPMPALSGSRGA
jgi:nucleoside-diphosphate-sugar epimerase